MGECLIWTLKTALSRQDAWNSDVADAWVWAYQMIAKVMSDAGEKATTTVRRKVSFSQLTVESLESGREEDDKSQKANEEIRTLAAAAGLSSIRSLVRSGITHRDDIELRPQSVALLVVDVQKELSTIEPDSPHMDYVMEAFPSMIKNTARLLRKMRSNRAKLVRMAAGGTNGMATGSECVFTYCESLTDDSRDVSLDYKLSGPLLAKLPCPSRPAQFVLGVEPVKGQDICLPKTSCSVFQSTNIDYVLKNLGVEQIVVCGQPIDQSVESAVRDAADRGYLVTVAVDACSAQSEADHERGMAGMRGFSRQLSTDEVISELSEGI